MRTKLTIQRYFITAVCILSFSLAVKSQALIRHTYHFYNNFSASAPDCGPDLTQAPPLGSCGAAATGGSFINDVLPACGVSRDLYHNNMYWGLRYPNTGGTITTNYTIHMYVKNTNWGTRPWVRIIDFSNGASDGGIYFKTSTGSPDHCLDFFPNGIVGPCPYFNNSAYYLLTFTRNGATGMMNVYVNNTLFSSYNDATAKYIGTTGTPIFIYRDDQVVACESGEANFSYLAFTNQFSSQTMVDSVYNLICTIANPGATSSFSLSPNPICPGNNATVTYTGNIASPGTGYSFNWSWDGGTVISGSGMGPYTVNWNTPGFKNVTLTVVNNTCGNQNSTTQQIEVSAGASTTINQIICDGQSYQGYTTTGTYVDHFTTGSGCDSVRTLNLTVKPRSFTTINQSICQGQSYQGYTASGTYKDTLVAANGCDSIRTLNLTVKPKSFSTITQSICEGQSFLGHNTTGIYKDTLIAANGCDSIRTLDLTVKPRSGSTINQTICQGQSFLGYTTAGTYKDTLLAANSCDSIRTLNLTVMPLPVANLGPDKELCKDDSLVLNPGVFTSYVWQDGSVLPYYVVKQPGVYAVAVTNSCGSTTDMVFIAGRSCDIYFPGAFTPNGDGKNDLFKMLNAFNLQQFELTVFNRWGQRIYQSSNYSTGWDGTINGEKQPGGVYIWMCRYKKHNVENFMKGTVLLLR